jgi:hypothetical protein
VYRAYDCVKTSSLLPSMTRGRLLRSAAALGGSMIVPASVCAEPTLQVGGTLVTVAPKRDGLAVGADRKTYDPVRRYRDNTMKPLVTYPASEAEGTHRCPGPGLAVGFP